MSHARLHVTDYIAGLTGDYTGAAADDQSRHGLLAAGYIVIYSFFFKRAKAEGNLYKVRCLLSRLLRILYVIRAAFLDELARRLTPVAVVPAGGASGRVIVLIRPERARQQVKSCF